MKKVRGFRRWSFLLALAVMALGPAHAEDIDIYGGTHSGASANLVIVLDNAAAASGSSTYSCPASVGLTTLNDPGKNFGFEQCGLYGALAGLKAELAAQKKADATVTQLPLNLGLMYFPGGPIDGGQFFWPAPSPSDPSQLLPLTDTNISNVMTKVGKLSLALDKSNNNQFSQALQETFAFYNGLQGLSGTQYGDLPSALQSCGANYVLYITLATNNQKPQDGGKRAQNALQALTGSFTQLTLPAYNEPYALPTIVSAKSKYQSDPSDEWAKFMLTAQVGNKQYNPVKAYTIILYDGSNPDYEQLMKNVSAQSGSSPYYVKLGDVDGLIAAVGSVARQVMAVNSVFAAPVLPVSANAQDVYDNQLYVGMFRPDARALPRWMGNLKQYQYGVDKSNPNSPQLFLADALGQRALSSSTGFLDPGATSFWTSLNDGALPDSKGGFWPSTAQYNSSGKDSPDGNVVEKGGVGQRVRLKNLTGVSARNVYTCTGSATCIGGAALSGMKFDASNAAITDALLGTDAAVTRANVIRWTRGEDVATTVLNSLAGPESSQPPDASIVVRGSVHGDVLHSRPAVLNYKTYGTVVFYGGNDGHLRAVNGNQAASANIGTTPPGGELWSFVPPEFFGGLRRLYDNAVTLTLGLPANTTRQPKTYFFDGAPMAYQDASGAYLFVSARRGGRLLYALDVTDPSNPKFLWRISNQSTGFSELGQTWSLPKVIKVKGRTDPVLVFGGGYDPNQDSDPPASGTDSMGRAIFVVDAKTGALLWSATTGGSSAACTGNPCLLKGMDYSIPADIMTVDRNFDGLADRLYAADVGGNLWRVDLQPDGTGAVSTWKAYQFAALGGTGTSKRKFFFRPDVVITKNFDAVVAVTGDREHPLAGTTGANSVVNRFYMIMDTHIGTDGSAGWSAVHDDTPTAQDNPPSGLFNATTAKYNGSGSGFYISLLTGQGEKGVNAPSTFDGMVYFGTNRPTTSSLTCAPNLGEARGYQTNFVSGTTTSSVFITGGMPISPVIARVKIGDSSYDSCVGCGGGEGTDANSNLGVRRLGSTSKAGKQRTYWYQIRDR